MHLPAAELDEERTYSRRRETVSTVKTSTASMLCAWRPQELAPGESGTLAGRPQTRLSEELAYGRGRDCQAEPAELADDPLVAPPRILARESQHERADLGADRRPTSASAVRPTTGDEPACQRSSVVGVTTNDRQLARGSRRLAAARKTRSADVSSGRPA
jgi:hypothetical protein